VRLRLGISKEELGFRAEVDRGYLSEIECGKSNPSFITLCRIAEALGGSLLVAGAGVAEKVIWIGDYL
jgi:transcriptional regulator with XRE-family HTH domain